MDLFVLKSWIQTKFTDDERGTSMVEYGLLLVLIAVAAVMAVSLFGHTVGDGFSNISSRVADTPGG